MRSILVKLGLMALMIGGLAGCGGTSIGVNGINGTGTSNATIVAGAVDARKLSPADFQSLRPTIVPESISVTISPVSGTYPTTSGGTVVKYKVVDQLGNPIVGLGGQSNNPAQTNLTKVPTNYDISFTLAKLIPAAAGEPSRWVNYYVTKLAATSTPVSAVVADSQGVQWTGQYPSADSNGTMVDNGDGTYQYTMLRDVTQMQAVINKLPATYTVGSATYKTADLDPSSLNYDPTATHRLGILLTGSQPGTGAAVPGGVAATGAIPAPLVYTVSQAYDFVPNGSAMVNTRDIVVAGSCEGCHDNVSQKRGLGHISTATAANGIPPGAYVGRNDPKLCVACHTDQTQFGYADVTTTTNADGSPAYSGNYGRVAAATVPPKNTSAFIYPRMIHQTHMGNQLVKTGYNLNAHATDCSSVAKAGPNVGQCFNLIGMPQDQRNCTKCHDGSATKLDGSTNTNKTAQGDNWFTVPSQLACGACHDGINFITGQGITLADRDADIAAKRAVGTTKSGHGASGPLPDNSQCTVCHKTGGVTGAPLADVKVAHYTSSYSLNSVGQSSLIKKISFNLKSVAVTSNQPVFVFQILVNNVAVTSLPTVPTVVDSNKGTVIADPTFQVLPGLVGGPSFYVAFAVPQDGITSPADFNTFTNVSLSNLLIASGSPKAGSITGPDANGYFTATLTGDTVGQLSTCATVTAPALQTCPKSAVLATPIVIPTTAKMVTGAIIGSFTQVDLPAPYVYTPANLVSANPTVIAKGGLAVVGDMKKMVATGYTARRVITSAALCNNCHDRLGTNPVFHGGARNDPTVCALCHNSTMVGAGGWNQNASTWLHGIHGTSKRTVPYTGAKTDFSTVLYPGSLKDCSQCHLPNTVNYGATAGLTGGALQPSLLWSYGATGTMATTTAAPAVTNPQVTTTVNSGNSPYVTIGTNYGNGFKYTMAGATVASYTPSTGTATTAAIAGAGGVTVPADSASLVSSPISAACFSCHDDFTAKNHMRNNGGVLYQPRGTAAALDNAEGCLACHGQGTIMDPVVIHQQQ